jgi:NADH-quinone oxidoreductase subunit E
MVDPGDGVPMEGDGSQSISGLLEKHAHDPGSLIIILQDIQRGLGYVPEEAVDAVAEDLGISPTRIYGILTFYSQFRLHPPGKHSLKVCQGTACHVMGGELILNYLSDKLVVKAGETTGDGQFSFERVACVGCCGMAPVVVVDEKPHGNSNITSIDRLIEDKKKEEG